MVEVVVGVEVKVVVEVGFEVGVEVEVVVEVGGSELGKVELELKLRLLKYFFGQVGGWVGVGGKMN